MIERMYIPAAEFWAAQPVMERTKMLEALKADVALANHDFAGLPPQVWAGIAAGMIPPAAPSDEPHVEHRGKKKGE